MLTAITDILVLINDVVQAAIVIFGSAIALYNLRHIRRDRVSRAFTALLFFVVIVNFAELAAGQAEFADSIELWIRAGWIGITMVPAAQFHLADALLNTTGSVSRRRRRLVRLVYLASLAVLLLAVGTDLIVDGRVGTSTEGPIARLAGGPLFWPFILYFWLITAVSLRTVWLARRRCLTHTPRQRMTTIAIVFVAAPLSVFPYLSITGLLLRVPVLFWLLAIVGNVVVGTMFSLLTVRLVYFGAASSDRLVRVRLYKFLARAPLTATIVLLVYVVVNRTGDLLGLPLNTALAVTIVATIIIVEGAIHAYKRPLERLFQLNDDPDVRRIQELSERVVTTRELHEFLESLLTSACNILQTPSAFVAAITPDGPQLEVAVGPLEQPEVLWAEGEWQSWQQQAEVNGADAKKPAESSELMPPEESPVAIESFFVWKGFWIRPLYGQRSEEAMLGVLGIKARGPSPDLSPTEEGLLRQILAQAAAALEDRILQQEVFAAVEGLLPRLVPLPQRRELFDQAQLAGAAGDGAPAGAVLGDPNFNTMVRDALSHYWGGPKLTDSPLMQLRIVQAALADQDGSPTRALRAILNQAIELQKPDGERSLTTAQWILYNILELKFVQGKRVREVARRLAMSESDLYRKQRVAIENVARTIFDLEQAAHDDSPPEPSEPGGRPAEAAREPAGADQS